MKRILITGTAGFIGYHLASLLLKEGFAVFGYDCMSDYYDVRLKQKRHAMLKQNSRFQCDESKLEDFERLSQCIQSFKPDTIVHLAGQAGVRYSIENPRAYLEANIIGSFNVMEAARQANINHLLMASTSSIYGANTKMPFCETEKADTQLSFYAATKKANEATAHSYAYTYGLPITMFRFFTVYGPWGRPDMALFKFTKAILEGKPIDVYNHGEMWRDFTYVEDLVQGIKLLIGKIPGGIDTRVKGDSLSPVAPFRIVNIGNSEKVRLNTFIEETEVALGIKAIRNNMEMQLGDVQATWANVNLLENLTGYSPRTDVRNGIMSFVKWYREYYKV